MSNVMNPQTGGESSILVVDLDGTLFKGDLLWESLLLYLLPAPWRIFVVISWVLKGGRTLLKAGLAENVIPDGTLLPWNPAVVAFCEGRAGEGWKIVLATASNESMARKVTAHFPFVSEVMGSDVSRNLKGEAKAELLVQRLGLGQFEYIGDSAADLPVWTMAKKAWFVGSEVRRRSLGQKLGKSLEQIGEENRYSFQHFFKAMRPHQWLKNLLIFVPLLAAHQWMDKGIWEQAIPVFFALCCVASASYLLNDLADLNADRCHIRKKYRAFASGDLSILAGLTAMLVLFACGMLLAAVSGPAALVATLAYFLFSVLYSLRVKSLPVFDVVFLSGLYTYRIVLGGIASAVMVSSWLLAFSITFFLGLALLKRYVELENLPDAAVVPGRGYIKGDLEFVRVSGIASGFLSVVVLALYLDSSASSALYLAPQWLWGIGLALLFWIIRVWFLAGRRQMNDDPVWFAARDPVTLVLGLVCLVMIILAGPI